MKRVRNDLIGIDFERTLRAAAKEIWDSANKAADQLERKKREYQYEQTHELEVMVFEERASPPLWRIETLRPGPNGMGIVTARDPEPRFLEAELRNVLAGKLEVYGAANNSAEARRMACKMVIRNLGTVRLKDSERFEGERR